jgi:hypothetical protein
MSTVFQICDRLTDAYAELSPMAATFAGVKGHDHLWDDLSPDGEAAKAAFYAAGAAELAAYVDDPDPVQADAARVVASHLNTELRRHESGHWRRDLITCTARSRVLGTPSTWCPRRAGRHGRRSPHGSAPGE